MAEKRYSLIFKTWLLVLVSGLFYGVSFASEKDTPHNEFTAKQKMQAQNNISLQYIEPLETKPFIDSEFFRLIDEKAAQAEKLDSGPEKIIFTPPLFPDEQKRVTLHRLENSLYTASLITLTALNVADYFSTVKALQYDGLKEGNPLMKPFTKNAVLFAAVKFGLTASNFYFMKKLHQKDKRLGWAVSLITNFAMTYIVVHNINMIHRAQER